MQNFPHEYKITIGLMSIISSVIAFIPVVYSKESLFILLLSASAGVYFAKMLFVLISIRTLVCLNGLFSFYGILLYLFSSNNVINTVGFALIGLSCGALLLLIPSNLTIMWFGNNKVMFSGTIWSFSSLLGIIFSNLIAAYPLGGSSVCLVLTMIGSVLIKKFPAAYKDPLLSHSQRISPRLNRKLLPAALFFLFLGLAQGLMYMMAVSNSSLNSSLSYMASGAVAAPLISSLFCNKKGVFSSCILLIFLSELCTMFLSFYNYAPFVQNIAVFLFGGVLTMTLCLLPVFCFYMFGPGNINSRLVSSAIFLPLGFLIAFFIPLTEKDLVSLTFLTILCSFFALFSAWRHRLTLLKSS